MKRLRSLGPALSFLALLAFAGAVLAQAARPLAEDEAVERRLNAIAEELRCLVCQNESLAGSRADLAQDLRGQIREQIKAGRSDDQILAYMTDRYGDFIRYRPPLKGTTAALWAGPFVLLAVAAGGRRLVRPAAAHARGGGCALARGGGARRAAPRRGRGRPPRMILFALGALALVAATLGFLLWPLARAPRASAAADAAATNAAVLRDQLAELERDHSAGTIADAEYEQAKLELKRRLLEDTAVAEGAPSAARRRPIAAVATAIALPITAAGLYFLLGAPGALDPEQTQPQLGRADIEAMVDKLAQRLQSRPDDAEGWAMLGRSYRVLGRNEEAAQAYAKAEKLVANDSRLLVDYAESLALAHGGNLQGKPAQLVARALELDPANPLGLMLSGAVAFQREDYAGAIRQWEKVQSRLEPGSEEAHAVGASIAKARELAAAGRRRRRRPLRRRPPPRRPPPRPRLRVRCASPPSSRRKPRRPTPCSSSRAPPPVPARRSR